jgi:hypothetical protein
MIPRPDAVSSWRRHFQRQAIERALCRADRTGRDLGVARCRRQIIVTEQNLDDPDVGSVLQEMGREAVAQRVHRHSLGQSRAFAADRQVACRTVGSIG